MRVTVMGGGIGGLATALFLGRRGHLVTVVERDRPPPAGDPEEAFVAWDRPGVPQARQPHMFLGGAVRVLRTEAPDVLEDLLAAGVLPVPADLGDGPGDAILCCRRITFETVLRRAAEREATVTVCSGAGVQDLTFEGDAVRGVRPDGNELVPADLVVDASGRRSPTPRFFAQRGLRPMPTVAQECGFMYISRHYRLHGGVDHPRTDVPIVAGCGWASTLAFPGDRGTFCLVVIISVSDPVRRVLVRDDGFARFLSMMPLTAPWLSAGEPISEIRTMARVENRYRRLVDDDGPIVGGMVLLGDATLHTNPTAGRGASLAFAQAEHLAATLDGSEPGKAFVSAFDAWTDSNIGVWYPLQAGADGSALARMEAAVRGEDTAPPDELEQLRGALIGMSKLPGQRGVLARRVFNLVSLPSAALGDPEFREAARIFGAPGSDARPLAFEVARDRVATGD
jgi:2-polyprenyl-6-methoxyphenol hydroxylase-like FAD-dependent oxidoreductase